MNPQTTTKSVNIMKVHSIPCTSNIWLHVNVISMPAMFDWFESLVIQDCLMLHFCCLYYPVYSQAQIPCVYICCFCPIFSLVAHQVRFKHGKNSLYCGWMSHPLLPMMMIRLHQHLQFIIHGNARKSAVQRFPGQSASPILLYDSN